MEQEIINQNNVENQLFLYKVSITE